jgi:hypothetical protein
MTRLNDPEGAAFKALSAQLDRWTQSLRTNIASPSRVLSSPEKTEVQVESRSPAKQLEFDFHAESNTDSSCEYG